MAISDFTQQTPQPKAVNFTYHSGGEFYQLSPNVSASDIHDYLSMKLAQLDAMLIQTYGEGGEAFQSCNDEIQENYLWACQMLAKECRELLSHVTMSMRESTGREVDHE